MAAIADTLDPASCEIDDMRNFVDASMRDYYLFFDEVPQVRLSDYEDVAVLLDDLRVAGKDRHSYIGDAALSSAFFDEGREFGFGMNLIRTDTDVIQVSLIKKNSPLHAAGVQRGDRLLAIDGVDVNAITSEQYLASIGTGSVITSPVFRFATGNQDPRDVTVTKAEYAFQTVHQADVIEAGSTRIGYLAFLSFLETSIAEIDAALDEFAAAGVTELVLDLRFNGGGRINVANHLASRLVGNQASERDFARVEFNSRYSQSNFSTPFQSSENSLDLPRVFVLTTGRTCSASEMVINGLRPFVDVISIGSTTCGKPYGSRSRQFCDKVLNALEVSFVNDSGVGDYVDGLAVDCPAADDLNHALGSSNEVLLRTALDYVDTGSCALLVADAGARKQTQNFMQGPVRAEGDDLRALVHRH